MTTYKMAVAQKRSRLEQFGFITWRNRQEVTTYLKEIAMNVTETRFENIVRSIVTSDMEPQEVVNYLRDIKIWKEE